jgi:glycyl-tRNA synthetase
MNQNLMEKIVSLCKRRGFIFRSSEIYGGLGSCYDYGPLGVELKNNIKKAWWKKVVQEREDVVGLDSAILLNPKVWEASGHVAGFKDPFYSCPFCKKQFRGDQIYDLIWNGDWWQSLLKDMAGHKTSKDLFNWAKTKGKDLAPNLALVLRPEVTLSWISDIHKTFKQTDLDFRDFIGRIAVSADGLAAIPCPLCGEALSEPTSANLMLSTSIGPVQATAQKTYLRPETAQGIFVNFNNVLQSSRTKIPFGIAQIGKSFRNEITPGNFIFRTREFEQMELEFFVHPQEAKKWHQYWLKERLDWYVKLGIKKENLRLREHKKNELAHYAQACSDVEYKFPFNWSELEGIANRGDFDLKQHGKFSGENLFSRDENGKKFIPYVIEPSAGVDRPLLAFFIDAYEEIGGGRTTTTESNKETEVVLHLHKDLAPIKIAILPLAKKEKLTKLARDISREIKRYWTAQYDEVGSIGRRYRRQDEIGTLYCLTIDFESLEDKKVTIRDRDTMKQKRVAIAELTGYLKEKLE